MAEDPNEKQKRRKLPLKKLVSALPLLWVFELGFLVKTILGAPLTTAETLRLLALPLLFASWGALVIYAGFRYQSFHSRAVTERVPMLWLPLPVVLTTLAVFLSNHDATARYLEFHGPRTFIGLQCVRVLALASIVKYFLGVFPFLFAWFTALPDFLFGLSALYLYFAASDDFLAENTSILAAWHLVGFLIIVPFGAITLQIGMKPLRLVKPKVPHDLIFEWPMVMGPSVVVPMLVAFNNLLAVAYSGRL